MLWSAFNSASLSRIAVLVDTSFWIDLLRERGLRRAGRASRFLARHRVTDFKVSLVTWSELAEGFPLVSELEFTLRGVPVLPLPQQVAWEASRIAREMRGHKLGENDNWIAATARIWGLRLVTRDAAFARVPKLNIISY